MLDSGIDQAITKPPTREQMADWCINSLATIDRQTIVNSWMSTGYSYFIQ
jgi:hypothetical protein